jgi:hypothetical protein
MEIRRKIIFGITDNTKLSKYSYINEIKIKDNLLMTNAQKLKSMISDHPKASSADLQLMDLRSTSAPISQILKECALKGKITENEKLNDQIIEVSNQI